MIATLDLDGGASSARVTPSSDAVSADHAYTHEVVGTGEPIVGRINDEIPSDNDGALRGTVREYR